MIVENNSFLLWILSKPLKLTNNFHLHGPCSSSFLHSSVFLKPYLFVGCSDNRNYCNNLTGNLHPGWEFSSVMCTVSDKQTSYNSIFCSCIQWTWVCGRAVPLNSCQFYFKMKIECFHYVYEHINFECYRNPWKIKYCMIFYNEVTHC